MNLGLTEVDAKVYIFLARKGLQKAIDMSKSMKMNKVQLYRSLKKLQSKGIVTGTLEHPARFSAVPFEKILDLFVKSKMEEAEQIQQNKDEILSIFQSFAVGETDATARFMVIEGRNVIYSKIQQMINEAKNQLLSISTVPSLMRADQFGLFDVGSEHPLKSNIRFKFLTRLSEQDFSAMKGLLKEMTKTKIRFEGRTAKVGLNLFPRMVIKDQEEAMFFLTSKSEVPTTEQDDSCLWTNSKALVQAFAALFEDMWCNATDIQKKIDEIETGKQQVANDVVTDEQTAEKRFEETANAAKKEIIIMNSPKGVMETWRNMQFLKERSKKGVALRIMAPITSENLEAARFLSEYCEVRHVPESYQETALIDGKYLFQFKLPSAEREKLETTPTRCFEDGSYTDDVEYVEKTRIMLDDIWKSASAIPKTVVNQTSYAAKLEQRIVGEIKVAGKTHHNYFSIDEKGEVHSIPQDTSLIARGNMGIATIYMPSHLNMPNIMIQATHFDEPSGISGLNMLVVSLWLKNPIGFGFMPTAIVTTAPVVSWEKMIFAGTPAERNIIPVKPHELEFYIKGSTLFAGWTKEIPLTSQYYLDAGCLVFESYGAARQGKETWPLLSGNKTVVESEVLNAFVTLMRATVKMEKPATQGRILRNFTMTTSRVSG
jgi:sugar-specific transcriptional regulator TrmB